MGIITDFIGLGVAGTSIEDLAIAGGVLFAAYWVFTKVADSKKK